MKILAIGECMAELAPTSEPRGFSLGFAGDTFNTAWYLAHLAPDAEVSYFTALGGDAISEDMRAFMQASGIDTGHIPTIPDRTVGLYAITLDNGERSFTYWRGQSAARELASDPAALDRALDGADLVFFSGITLAILEPEHRTALLDALSKARAGGKTIAFDPNLRPRLWANGEEMCREIMRGAAVSDIALPSFEDEATWFSDADPQATAKRYGDAGASTIIVKNGSEAVLYTQAGGSGEVPVEALESVVDTTAAGDSFNAGVLAGIVQNAPLPKGIAHACKLARMVVQAKGALVPINLDLLTIE